jgi:hypothetical protein
MLLGFAFTAKKAKGTGRRAINKQQETTLIFQ